ncbi:GvpL/GvpF family gas vesicle protein [Streptomyces sp. NBC_01353]|uniref:GvpL/GvpF family gas vesicle protein n=1 Tax=Streptomyces sp. NBC_01353 TaxID=2903835 RepID=UPI002E32A61E|nr:GvpL/GvpF family gas vesicle protein [Streptomyces sp. NBC_01353]
MTPGPLLYVYAVVASSPAPYPPPTPDELPDAPLGASLALVEHRGLTAVVEPVDAGEFDESPLREHLEDLDWLASVARAHHRVVDAVGRRTTTVPIRLATICRGEAGVRRLLSSGHDRLRASLERVAGTEEWGVKLYVDDDADPSDRTESQRPATSSGSADSPGSSGSAHVDGSAGRDYLRRRLDDRRTRQDRAARISDTADRVHALLATRATDAVRHPPQHARLSHTPGRNVLNTAYLVPVEGREAFLEAVPAPDDLPDGVRVDMTGPWVPYSFAQSALEPEANR